jgi:hypothetical protein
MLRNKSTFQISIHVSLSSISICKLLIDLPSYHPKEKASVIADCLADEFTSHDTCDETQERQVETTGQVLLASVDGIALGKVKPCDIHKLANTL